MRVKLNKTNFEWIEIADTNKGCAIWFEVILLVQIKFGVLVILIKHSQFLIDVNVMGVHWIAQ